MLRRIFLAALLPLPAAAQTRRRRPRARTVPPTPTRPAPAEIDPAPRAGTAPMANRRFPTEEQAARPGLQVLPGIPTARSPSRGSTYSDRDMNHDSLGRGTSPIAEPGLSVRIPFR